MAGEVTGAVDAALARALADWRHAAARLYLAARDYMTSLADEADAVVAYATASAAGAPAGELADARCVLAHVMAARDGAGRRLGLAGGLPVGAARAAEELVAAARTARSRAVAS